MTLSQMGSLQHEALYSKVTFGRLRTTDLEEGSTVGSSQQGGYGDHWLQGSMSMRQLLVHISVAQEAERKGQGGRQSRAGKVVKELAPDG